MRVGFIVTHLSHGSPGSFVRIQELLNHIPKDSCNAVILTPFEEDHGNAKEVNIEVLPSQFSSLRLSSTAYKIARKMAASRLTSRFFHSEFSILRMAAGINKGLTKLVAKETFDAFHAVQCISALAAIPVAREQNIPLITDLHNIWPEHVLVEGLCKKGDTTYEILKKYEDKVIRYSDAVTVPSEFMRTYIQRSYNSARDKKIVVVPPAGPKNIMQPLKRNRNVIYAGMVNSREYVELFARSIPHVTQPCSFFVSDYGDDLAKVKKITGSNHDAYAKVSYIWFKRRQEVIEFLNTGMVGILTSRNDVTRQLGPPLKLYDYLACGLPVVANDIGGWCKMISEENIGFLSADDPKSFAKSIDMLLSDPSLWLRMHQNAVRLINEKYNWDYVVKNSLLPLYKDIVKSG